MDSSILSHYIHASVCVCVYVPELAYNEREGIIIFSHYNRVLVKYCSLPQNKLPHK